MMTLWEGWEVINEPNFRKVVICSIKKEPDPPCIKIPTQNLIGVHSKGIARGREQTEHTYPSPRNMEKTAECGRGLGRCLVYIRESCSESTSAKK